MGGVHGEATPPARSWQAMCDRPGCRARGWRIGGSAPAKRREAMSTRAAPQSGTDAVVGAGLGATADVRWNLQPAQLYEHALRRGEGLLAATGPLAVETGEHTGRSPRD